MSTPLCILLVDDSSFFLTLEQQFLKQTPATIYTAKSAGEALETARRYLPSLIYMDIDMPDVNGVECCRQMAVDQALRRIPVILIGDRGRPEQEAAARAAGCADYLEKPLDRRLFLGAGHRLLVSIDRREPRRDCQLPVSFAWGDGERHGLCIDISSGGMFLKIEPRAVKGDVLSLRLRLPDAKRTPVNLSGRVAWINLPGALIKPDYPVGYGIEFIEISEAAGVALRHCFGV